MSLRGPAFLSEAISCNQTRDCLVGISMLRISTLLAMIEIIKTKTPISNRDESQGSRGTTLVFHTSPGRLGGTLIRRRTSSCSGNEEQLRLAYSVFSARLRDDFRSAILMWLSPRSATLSDSPDRSTRSLLCLSCPTLCHNSN